MALVEALIPVDIAYKPRPETLKPALWEFLCAAVGTGLVTEVNGGDDWATAGEIASALPLKISPDTALRRSRKLVELGYFEVTHFAYYDIFSRNFFRASPQGIDLCLAAYRIAT